MRFSKGHIPWNKDTHNTSKKKHYFCKECNVEITKRSVQYGLGMCKSCSHKGDRNINKGGLLESTKIKLSKIRKGRPSSFKGRKHTEESKKKNKNSHLGKPNFKIRGDSNPAKRSEVRAKMRKPHLTMRGKNHPCFGKPMIPKFVKYKNTWFRSTWEVIYAKELDSKSIKWQYESKTFDLGHTSYTPDFYLSVTNEYIEVKGYISDIFKYKFELFKQLYPDIKIKILDETYFR